MTNDDSFHGDSTPYLGNDNVTIGNGSFMAISKFGSSIIAIDNCSLKLPNVLNTPKVLQKFLSVQKLCFDGDKIIEFHASKSFIKDSHTEEVVLKAKPVMVFIN